MIVPMKKVSMVILDSERKTSLKKLRKLGLVHLQELEGHGELLTAQKNDYAKLETALALLSDVKKDKTLNEVKLDTVFSIAKAEEIISWYKQREEFEDKTAAAKSELERLQMWGEVDVDDLVFLSEKGIQFFLYEIPNEKYDSLGDDVETIFVNKDRTTTRFLLVLKEGGILSSKGSNPDLLPPEAFTVILPPVSTKKLKKNIVDYAAEIKNLSEKINKAAACTKSLKAALALTEKTVEFENIYTGMERDAEGCIHALAWITGYIPAADLPKLQTTAQTEHWALAAGDPAEEDEVPTKLKNNKIVGIITPLLDFLGTVPGYREYDMSFWFLLFFSIFFGMIFGDAGYGFLLLFAGLAGIIISIKNRKSVPAAFILLTVLSCTTIIWGTFTCSWFGIDQDLVPQRLKDLSLWIFNGKNPDSGLNIQTFCFVLALVQLSIAHIMTLFRNVKQKSLKFLADIGSLGILWGMFMVVLNMLISAKRFPLSNITPALIGGGFILSFVFSNYEGNIGKSILASLKNIISVLLGVINFFADIISYIRLWAVGVAGAAIAQTVNTLAGPMLGTFLLFAGILLLLFGHGLNMILNVLSVIVHGVRLNTLEFTNHLGMTWSGFKYEPFSEAVRNNKE